MPTPTTDIPIFSDTLKKLLNELDCKPAKLIRPLTAFEIKTPCDCASCVAEDEEDRKKLGAFNHDCGMNYFSWREKEGMISYLPAGKPLATNENGSWSRKCRQEIAPGRWVLKVLAADVAKTIRDEELSQFTSQFNAKEQAEKISFKEVTIKEAYNSQIRSCMKDKPVQPFYDQFDCCAVVAMQRGAIIGRAVLWKDVQGQPTKAPLMDRIYPGESVVTEAMLQYARDQGWWFKVAQSADSAQVAKEGVKKGVVCDEWKVIPKEPEKLAANNKSVYFPYLDTFSHSDKLCTYFTRENVRKGWEYYNQEGLRKRDTYGMVQCQITQNYLDKEDALQFQGYWYSREHVVTCKISKVELPVTFAFKVSPPGEAPYYISKEYINKGR